MNVEPLSRRERGRGEVTDLAKQTEPSSALAGHLLPEGEGKTAQTEAERWILSRLHATLVEVEQHFSTYRFDLLAQALYEFVWNDYCDWFLELSKPALGSDDADAAASTRRTLLGVLDAALRALHPIIPFITEEIRSEMVRSLGGGKPASPAGPAPQCILELPYPRADEYAVDTTASAEIEWLKAVLAEVRRIRSEMNIAPGKTIPLLFANGDAEDRRRAGKFAPQIMFLARCETPRWLAAGAGQPAAAAAVVGTLRVLIPLAGLIDVDAEKVRLGKEIQRLEGEIAKSTAKLANFGERTPAPVIEQERNRLADWNSKLDALREQAARLAT